MHFFVKQQDILNALGRVLPAVPTKSTLPILSNVLFQLEGNKLKIVATDLEISVLTEMEVDGKVDGSLSIPAKKLSDILRELEGKELIFKADESLQLHLTSGDGTFQVPGISSQEFPNLPDFNGAEEFSIPASKIDSMIQRTAFAASKDELRPALTGVFFQIKPNELRAVSTDGHRLVKIVDHDFKYSGEAQEIIIPRKALEMIRKNLPGSGEIKIILGTNQIMVQLENTILYSRLIEGKYPHYESVIPANNNEFLTVSTSELTQVVKRIQIFSNPISRQVIFHINKDLLEISAEDIELGGKGSEKIVATFDGSEMDIGYNASYILDLLKQVETEKVRFELGGATQAGIIKPTEHEKNEDFLMLIMPVRLN